LRTAADYGLQALPFGEQFGPGPPSMALEGMETLPNSMTTAAASNKNLFFMGEAPLIEFD